MTRIGRFSLAIFVGLVWLVAAPLVAGADELKGLKAQVKALMQRIEALEAQTQEQATV